MASMHEHNLDPRIVTELYRCEIDREVSEESCRDTRFQEYQAALMLLELLEKCLAVFGSETPDVIVVEGEGKRWPGVRIAVNGRLTQVRVVLQFSENMIDGKTVVVPPYPG